MDLTVLEVTVAKLSADLEPTSSQLLWILNIYGFFVAEIMGTPGGLNQFDRRYARSPSRSSGTAYALTSPRYSGGSLCATRGSTSPPELVKLGGR